MARICNSVFLLAVVCVALISGCSDDEPTVLRQPEPQREALVDSAQNRQAMALKVVSAYSSFDWGNDITARVTSQVGEAVAEEARERIRTRLTDKQIVDLRLKLLTDTFTATELEKLSELYSDPASKGLLRKISVFEERVKDQIQPTIVEVMSGETR